jgi:hypothetical protein
MSVKKTATLVLTSDRVFCIFGPAGCPYVPTMVPVPRMDSIFGKRQAATRTEELAKPLSADGLMGAFYLRSTEVHRRLIALNDNTCLICNG